MAVQAPGVACGTVAASSPVAAVLGAGVRAPSAVDAWALDAAAETSSPLIPNSFTRVGSTR